MKKCLSGAMLKWIAMLSMLIDHFTAVFFEASVYNGPLIFSYNTYVFLRGVGRLAFPIYCFLLVEGFLHTRSVKNYLLRLLLFGIEPKTMELGIGLSPEAERGIEKALAEVVKSLGELGHEVTVKAGILESQ